MNIDPKYAETSYSVTIVAENPADERARTTISSRVRIDEDLAPQVVEVSVMAPKDGALSANVVRSIDFDGLIQWLGTAVTGVLPAAEPSPKTTYQKVGELPGRSAESARETRGARTERPYRRMPDAELVADVFRRSGSVGQVARHFDVPRYTAQAWVDRLRRGGVL
ncbi:hypothetical protein [Streptomyces violens]|uniref:hypothetical protein n=1 Tax=Streptomyces violens TaxID=66377 RepID=UPI0004C0B6CC|nr:hypothetical protein [Streptomyces violens]